MRSDPATVANGAGSGRGQFSMEFAQYAPCPTNVADEVIAKVKAEKEAGK